MIGVGIGLTQAAVRRRRGDALAALAPIGVWYAKNAVTDGNRKVIPNAVSSVPVSPNMLTAPRRLFNNSGLFGRSGVTIVDNATGNTGSTFAGSGNFSFLTAQIPNYPAGDYTIVIDCERNDATDQTFAIGWGAVNLATKVATSTRQRLTHTATLSGPQATYLFKSFDGSTGANIRVYEVAIYPGTEDLEPSGMVLDGHLCLGRYPLDTVPTISSGIVDASASGAAGVYQWDTAPVLSDMTAIWLTEAVSDASFYDVVFGSIGGTANAFGPKDSDSFTGQNPANPLFSGRSLSFSIGTYRAYIQPRSLGRSWEAWACTCSSSGATSVFHNKVKMVYGQTNAAVTSQTIAQLWFGAYNATSITSGIRIKGAALFDKVLTDEEIRTAVDALQANAEQTVAARPWYHIHEGDSLSAVTFFPAVAARDMTPPTVFANYAVGGSSFTDHNVRRPSILAVPAGVGSGEQSLFTIYAASNELSKVGVSVSDFLNTYVEYITAIRNAGYDLIGVGTLLPTTIAGYNTKRNEANTTIYTWPGTGFVDFLFDFAADSTLGPDAAASDTMWYIDGIHPTTAGQAILKTIYQTAVETALAA